MKRLPALPKSVPSPLGPIPVLLVAELRASDGDQALGLWVPEERTIKLRIGLHPTTAWATLWHERIHAALWDAGVNLASDAEERVCDALSTTLVADMLHS